MRARKDAASCSASFAVRFAPSDAARRQAMSYDLNRHLELVSAYKAELARLKGEEARLSATALAGART